MTEQSNAEIFLASFNRINKYMIEKTERPSNMAFVSLVNHLKKRKDLRVALYANDLIQFAQLRNAIVHDQIGVDFFIAEPNDWAVNRIRKIEDDLLHPEKVIPRFKKKITVIQDKMTVQDFLKIVAEKKYTQYPVVENKTFIGLITLQSLGLLLAEESQKGVLDFSRMTVKSLLERHLKIGKFQIVDKKTPVFQVIELFQFQPTLEVVVITKNGQADSEILGLIRPRDLFKIEN
jgi:CBS domain-containing protein